MSSCVRRYPRGGGPVAPPGPSCPVGGLGERNGRRRPHRAIRPVGGEGAASRILMRETRRNVGKKRGGGRGLGARGAWAGGAEIRTEGLVRRFGENAAVNGVDLAVEPGEIYGFLGPNGAGKTTTVRMLVTLLSPTSGRATVAGRDVVFEPHEVRLRIGVALQEGAAGRPPGGAEILHLQGRLYGLTAAATKRRPSERGGLIDLGDAR